MTTIKYERPESWIRYQDSHLIRQLTDAKAAVMSLRTVPYQRRWVETLQEIELKREVAGTSRIEGAVFTEGELDAAMEETPAELFTRSQRQARAAVATYRWIPTIPSDRPIDGDLIKDIHRRIVTGADDDRCEPGGLRTADQNVVFGLPRHRGVEGGTVCEETFADFTRAMQQEYQEHDPIVQAIAAHYHLAAMHPFLDGNGRTARALEALMLQRIGLRETSFIAMSNYYYHEQAQYLSTLAEVRRSGHDLTAFLSFALEGVTQQCQRLLTKIQREIQKELYLNLAQSLYSHLKTPKKRVIAERQLEIIRVLLRREEEGGIDSRDLIRETALHYANLKFPIRGLARDLHSLLGLDAISMERTGDNTWIIKARLDWPTRMTETDLFKRLKELPKAKTSLVHEVERP